MVPFDDYRNTKHFFFSGVLNPVTATRKVGIVPPWLACVVPSIAPMPKQRPPGRVHGRRPWEEWVVVV